MVSKPRVRPHVCVQAAPATAGAALRQLGRAPLQRMKQSAPLAWWERPVWSRRTFPTRGVARERPRHGKERPVGHREGRQIPVDLLREDGVQPLLVGREARARRRVGRELGLRAQRAHRRLGRRLLCARLHAAPHAGRLPVGARPAGEAGRGVLRHVVVVRPPHDAAVVRRHLADLRVRQPQVGLEVRQLHVGVVVARGEVARAREGVARPRRPQHVLERAPERRVAHVEHDDVAGGPRLLERGGAVLAGTLRHGHHEAVDDAAVGKRARHEPDLVAPRPVVAAGEVAQGDKRVGGAGEAHCASWHALSLALRVSHALLESSQRPLVACSHLESATRSFWQAADGSGLTLTSLTLALGALGMLFDFLCFACSCVRVQ